MSSAVGLWRDAILSEVSSTSALVVLCGVCGAAGGGGLAVVYGCAVVLLMQAFGDVRMNPALCLADYVCGRVTLSRSVARVLSQVLGAAVGHLLLYVCLPTAEGRDVQPPSLCIQTASAMALTMAHLSGRCTEAKWTHLPQTGIAVTALSLAMGNMSSRALMNPVLIAHGEAAHWMWWPPLLGAAIAAPLYKYQIFL